MHKFDEWHEKARKEFKTGEFYEKDIGEDFSVTESGDVHLGNFHVIKNAVTPLCDFL